MSFPSPTEKHPDTTTEANVEPSDAGSRQLADKSPGVVRIEAIAANLGPVTRIILFTGIFLVGYAFGLDAVLRNVYQTYATASYRDHSLLSTVNVIRTVFAAAAQPTTGKLADAFGRVETLTLSVVFYLVGSIVEATSNGVASFCAGAVLYTLGFTIVQTLVDILIADVTSTRVRLLATYVPNLHFIITAWVSGNISSAVLGSTTWRWGIGMWCIIFTVLVVPVVATLVYLDLCARRNSSATQAPRWIPVKQLFWQLDVPGIILLIASLALLLTPLTIAGGESPKWRTAHVIAPLVIGFLCIPLFIFWQTRAPHPLVPFSYLKDRGVWGALGIAAFMNFANSMQSNYLYTVLIVAFDFSITAATRIATLFMFTMFLVGPICGILVYRVHRLKYFIIAGTVLFIVGFGLLIRYRSGSSGSNHAGIIAAEVILGIGGGMTPYASLASMQSSLKHENLGVMTGLFLACHSMGNAFGASVAGAMWSQLLPSRLATNLGDVALAAQVYGNPFAVVAQFPVGTDVRTAIIDSYRYVQRYLCITGLCLSLPMIGFAFCLRNPILSRDQSLAEKKEASAEDRA
ncbi:siderophore transporter [Penicillium chermesinum]|uniref:Siderophore transporter n=1 Tax=Penicillium chermesinum TaxID=63820 RepID=A0A9W9PM56_9EURO|nr:siderophore transporter [Penicillium chermesinum]KAJ5249269.1 siderophore transporter [Penicillium chermesinum]KAJ6151358.1 siderophore transporter [Penicillium chermesinum]